MRPRSLRDTRNVGASEALNVSQTLCLRSSVTKSRYPLVFGRTGDPIARALRMSQNQKMLDQEVLRDPVSQDPVNPPGGCLQVTPYRNQGPGVPTTVGWK